MADLVDLTTGFKCPFGGSTININVSLRPGYDATRQGFGAASSQVVDLPRGELSVPDVEVGQFSHKCLGGIKSTTKCILEWKKKMKIKGLKRSFSANRYSIVYTRCFFLLQRRNTASTILKPGIINT